MANIWVVSDTHLNHANILKFTDDAGNLIRGSRFANTREMDECILENWNSVVKPGDKVYHLGDVMFGDREYFKKLWPRFHGSKRLIVGNHDDIKFLSSGGFFAKVDMWRMFTEFGLLLTHVPVHPSNLRIFATEGEYVEGDVGSVQKSFVNIHGHIHQNASPPGPYRNMSVEVINYTPVNIEKLRVK